MQSKFVGPSPLELGAGEPWSWCKDILDDIMPCIKDRYIPFD